MPAVFLEAAFFLDIKPSEKVILQVRLIEEVSHMPRVTRKGQVTIPR